MIEGIKPENKKQKKNTERNQKKEKTKRREDKRREEKRREDEEKKEGRQVYLSKSLDSILINQMF